MSQYTSRIHIKVSSPKVWSKFEDEDDASFDLAEIAKTQRTSFIIDGEWSAVEDELKGVVEALSETLGEDGIIIADTTNINVDPYDYCILYLGSHVRTEEFARGKKAAMAFETSISDIPGWLRYGGFHVSEKEKEVLFRCGISSIGGHFEEFSAGLELPEQIYLRETSFGKRPDTIEQTLAGEEVYFVHSRDSYDPLRIEVMSELGSLGYLPSEVSDQITPVLSAKRLKYTARVSEVVPASKRNKHAKSSIVSVHIDAEVSDKEEPVKNSVPKTDREALAEEATRKAEQERRRKEEEARRAEEERKRKEEEARRAEEERKRQEAVRKAEQERKRKAEEARIAKEKAEAEARAREEAEARRKAEEERKHKEQEAILKKYEEAHAAWDKECASVSVKRADTVAQRLAAEKARLEAKAKSRYEAAMKSANDKKAEQAGKKTDAESALASLGFFKFRAKKIQRANIAAAAAGTTAAEADLKKAEESYKSEMAGIASKLSAMKNRITSEVEKEIPLPKEPDKPVT